MTNFALKMVMAVTGVMFALFALIHMYGNLKAFIGPEAYNNYSFWLREAFYPLIPKMGVLWIMRVVLGTSFIAHILAGTTLFLRARKARGSHRRTNMPLNSWAARTMIISGLFMLVFVTVHLLDMTVGTLGAEGYRHATADESFAYQNMILSFSRPLFAWFSALAMIVLWAHLAHGLVTVVNDLGVTGKRLRAVGAALAGILALAIMAGNILLPILVQLGVLA